jgi:protein-S-isoprenylcysteine O-methyltransferase Ste14
MEDEVIFRLIFAAFTLLFGATRMYYHWRARTLQRRRTKQEGRLAPVVRRVTGGVGCAVLLLWLIRPRWVAWSLVALPETLRWTGAGLAPLTLALLLWVHRTLDANFSPTLRLTRQQTLVTHGPYRHIRHPMYTVLLLTGLTVSLLTANWVICCVTVPGMILSVLLRLPHEEAMMIERFGDEYRHYMQRTGLILPRLVR